MPELCEEMDLSTISVRHEHDFCEVVPRTALRMIRVAHGVLKQRHEPCDLVVV